MQLLISMVMGTGEAQGARAPTFHKLAYNLPLLGCIAALSTCESPLSMHVPPNFLMLAMYLLITSRAYRMNCKGDISWPT